MKVFRALAIRRWWVDIILAMPRLFVLLMLFGGLAACGGSAAPVVLNPLAQYRLFVDEQSKPAQQERSWRALGNTADADTIHKIAVQPLALWISEDIDRVEGRVRDVVDRSVVLGQVPVLVGYYIPGRDCGSYSGGGATDAAAYRGWIERLVLVINGRSTVVILEPDAVAHTLAGCQLNRELVAERYQLLATAIQRLKAAGAIVYLDAGNPGFGNDTSALVHGLVLAGISRADGFALNVANFYSTDAILAYGRRLSKALGGKHFVIDSSRNGAGPPTPTMDGSPTWCNPPGRALGHPPTVHTGQPLLDAYLWIKTPGESDGNCRPGEPQAGDWWPEYALSLAR